MHPLCRHRTRHHGGEEKREQLLWKTTLLEAQLDFSIDGILVVDRLGKKILQNRRMNELWKIPRHIVEDKDDAAQVVFATNQTRNPRQSLKRWPTFTPIP